MMCKDAPGRKLGRYQPGYADNRSACTKDKNKSKQQSGGMRTTDYLRIHMLAQRRGGAHVAQENIRYYGTTLISVEGG